HLACRKLDLARFGELARIAEEIEQDLPQPHGVHGQCAEVLLGVNPLLMDIRSATRNSLKTPGTLLETLEELKGIGYVADAEFGLEITEKGRAVRQTINVRPREGLINKISKIVSVKVNVSLKDLK